MAREGSISASQKKYLDANMNQVSRSFALVVPFLEAPLNHWIATAYLICRMIDNIEDCTRAVDWKAQRFDELHGMLEDPRQARSYLTAWEAQRWDGLTANETAMMGVAGGCRFGKSTR